ncbi:hypothetical protein [Amycolatopsis thermoflava]|uniref:hypothetical protein n=1 Tax=Amycolatopsis thermoflava TaxID=84480 RepID=UPI003EBF7C91
MTRLLITDPGAAHPAKNAAAPGLPNQPQPDQNGETPMVAQAIYHQAARRTGYRYELVIAPVEIIARRHREGQSVAQITRYMQSQLGPDHQAAARNFVEWVIAATGGERR